MDFTDSPVITPLVTRNFSISFPFILIHAHRICHTVIWVYKAKRFTIINRAQICREEFFYHIIRRIFSICSLVRSLERTSSTISDIKSVSSLLVLCVKVFCCSVWLVRYVQWIMIRSHQTALYKSNYCVTNAQDM